MDENKKIPANLLAGLLEQLPHDVSVSVNAVGNLMVLNGQDEYIGYIDIRGDHTVKYSNPSMDRGVE